MSPLTPVSPTLHAHPSSTPVTSVSETPPNAAASHHLDSTPRSRSQPHLSPGLSALRRVSLSSCSPRVPNQGFASLLETIRWVKKLKAPPSASIPNVCVPNGIRGLYQVLQDLQGPAPPSVQPKRRSFMFATPSPRKLLPQLSSRFLLDFLHCPLSSDRPGPPWLRSCARGSNTQVYTHTHIEPSTPIPFPPSVASIFHIFIRRVCLLCSRKHPWDPPASGKHHGIEEMDEGLKDHSARREWRRISCCLMPR